MYSFLICFTKKFRNFLCLHMSHLSYIDGQFSIFGRNKQASFVNWNWYVEINLSKDYSTVIKKSFILCLYGVEFLGHKILFQIISSDTYKNYCHLVCLWNFCFITILGYLWYIEKKRLAKYILLNFWYVFL